jgi:hypothetical protein
MNFGCELQSMYSSEAIINILRYERPINVAPKSNPMSNQ